MFLLNSPYFDGIGILYEEMQRERQAGADILLLDAIEPHLYPEVKNFTPPSVMFWRWCRRGQMFRGLGARPPYTRLRAILPAEIPSIAPDAAITSVARLALYDHAVCHAMPDAGISAYVEAKLDETARTLLRIREGLAGYLDRHAITRVFIFNGRNPVSRLLEGLCAERGITTVFLEYFGKRDGAMTYVAANIDIFDMDELGAWIAESYAAAGADREHIAEATLEDRIVNLDPLLRSWNLEAGIGTGVDEGESKQLVSFFFSSEDEYPALKPSRYGLPDPTHQFDTFRRICEGLVERGLSDAYRWEMKLHPRYLVESKKLDGAIKAWGEAIAFVRSIGIDVKVHEPTASPYAIISRSALVVSYGSTAWEACYLGKPSVLLGPAPFAGHGCAYDAQDVATVLEHIANIPPPRPRENAYPYAWGWSALGRIPTSFRAVATSDNLWGKIRLSLSNRFRR